MTVLLAFTLEQASRVTHIPERGIRYWGTTGILSPSLANKEDRGAYSRIYSFRDPLDFGPSESCATGSAFRCNACVQSPSD